VEKNQTLTTMLCRDKR